MQPPAAMRAGRRAFRARPARHGRLGWMLAVCLTCAAAIGCRGQSGSSSDPFLPRGSTRGCELKGRNRSGLDCTLLAPVNSDGATPTISTGTRLTLIVRPTTAGGAPPSQCRRGLPCHLGYLGKREDLAVRLWMRLLAPRLVLQQALCDGQ